MEDRNKFRKYLLLAVSIFITVFVGLYLRFDDLKVWNQYKERFFYKDTPLFTSYDAFFFAHYSKEYLNGSYKAGERDHLRFVPDNATYPSPIPMESFLGAKLSEVFNTNIENIALWLTPILSIFFVVPLTVYFFRLNLFFAGFVGALFGVVNFIYLVRTSIARFDTDSLNLFFPFGMALFFLLALNSEGKRKYIYLATAGILTLGYSWWYAHYGITLSFLILYLLVAVFIKAKESQEVFFKEKLLASIRKELPYFGILLLLSNPVFVYRGIFNFLSLVKTYLINFFKPAVSGGFPNVFMSISEAQHFDIVRTADLSSGNILLFAIGLLGVSILFVKRFRETVFLLPIFLIGLMALKGGNRFIMYLSPFIGIGIGYLIDSTLSFFKRKEFLGELRIYFLILILLLLLPFLLLYFNKNSVAFVIEPKITPELQAGFIKLGEIAPKNSWIWTWWDYGYAIQYLATRATFHDGGSQGSPKTYFVATTFSIDSPKVAHNTILGIANIGAKGISDLVKEGKREKEIRNMIFSGKFSKPTKNPIYWVFTEDEIGKFMWINYFGTWNFDLKKGIKSPIFILKGCRLRSKNLIICGNNILDLQKGIVISGGKAIPIKSLVIRNENGTIYDKNYREKGIYLEILKEKGRSFFFVMGEQPFRSMFNQMYILRNYDKKYFELVYDDFPTIVVYKINQKME
ncbi:MAG: STT3 domain-containing protein [Desulfurobacteriaceae bacterium]